MRALAFLLLGSACSLGGEGRPDGGGTDSPTVNPVTCQEAMQSAPIAPSGYDFHDALPTAQFNTWGSSMIPDAGDPTYPGGRYRTITPDGMGNAHPGCSTAGLSYTAATIPGYACAAREFPFPTGVAEDTAKPIVVLVHGNSETPEGWMKFVHENPGGLMFPADTTARDQLAEKLPALGFRTVAIDLRVDRVDDPPSPSPMSDTGNTPKNVDHGWSVPLLQELLKKLAIAHPDRKLSVVGFSLGATTVRDALRRLWVENADGTWDVNIFTRVQDVIVASGANHGVKSFSLCGPNRTMRGTVTCEMGQRNQYSQTAFHRPLNGPPIEGEAEFGGWFETPCADGDYAFGKRNACGGKTVQYTTITMKDLENGTQQDEFVSEHASRLYPTACANNLLNSINDFDTSGYFFNGLFRSHYGAVRSEAGLAKIVTALRD